MAARTGMAKLITRLRRLIDDAPLDVNTTRAWEDDELQEILDHYRNNFKRERLRSADRTTTSTGKVYNSRHWNLEEITEDNDAIFRLYDTDGTTVSANDYAIDYITGEIVFTADQDDATYFLDGRSYDLHAAAAYCWLENAGHKASKYSFTDDAGSKSRSDWFKHCQAMSEMHAAQATPRIA